MFTAWVSSPPWAFGENRRRFWGRSLGETGPANGCERPGRQEDDDGVDFASIGLSLAFTGPQMAAGSGPCWATGH
jgi:hypothetical protein